MMVIYKSLQIFTNFFILYFILDSDSEGNSALKTAWGELAAIERETKRYKEIKVQTEKDLELCRQKGVALEDVRIFYEIIKVIV